MSAGSDETWIAGVFVIVVAMSAGAGSSVRTGPPLLRLGATASSEGAAGAAALLATGAGALWDNPAGLALALRPEAWLSQGILSEAERQQFVGAVFPRWAAGGRRVWGVSLGQLAGRAVDLVEDESPAGTARPSDLSLGVSAAQGWGPEIGRAHV
jgi:hypothetical protein